MTLSKGHNYTKGDNPEFKKYGSVRIPSMKFPNPILKFVWTDGRTSPMQNAHKMKLQEMTIYRRHMSSRDNTNFVTSTTGLRPV